MWAIAWFFFLGFVTMMTAYRIEIRERYGINGNAAEDFFASCFYPACALQVIYSAIHPVICKVLKMRILGFPPAGGPLL